MPAKRKPLRKPRVRIVKASPEEMAYDPTPEQTEKWAFVGRGRAALLAKPPVTSTVRLDSDVAKVFKTAADVNKALRKLIEAMPTSESASTQSSRSRKRSA